MKLIIDIPEEAYNRLLTEQHLPNRLDIEWCIVHGIPIPDNATNGEEIRALFPYTIFSEDISTNRIVISKDWWNAPYQKGGKE